MIRSYFLFISIIFSVSVFAQGDYYLGHQKFPFINYDTNIIDFTNGYDPLTGVYEKLNNIIKKGKGQINIVHIGGSHIQADVYTHLIRQRLQNMQFNANGGRGLIFPFRMARTNNPRNYYVKYTGSWSYCKSTMYRRVCNLGLTGMQVATNSSKASLTVMQNLDSSNFYTASAIDIFHNPTDYQVSVVLSDTLIVGVYDTAKGATYIDFGTDVNEFNINLVKNNTGVKPFELYGINLKSDNSGIIYHSVGVNGSMLGHYLKCKDYEKHLHALEPDLVIFSIGTNDGYTRNFNKTKYYDNYTELLNRTLSAAPNAAIMLTVPNDSYLYKRYINKNTEQIREVIYALSKKYNTAIWDFFCIMGGLNSAQTWYHNGLMQYDRIHFSRSGYLLKGELFFTAFLKGWENYLDNTTYKNITSE